MYFSAHRHKIYCISKQILDENISMLGKIAGECPNEKKSKNFDSKLLNFRDSLPDIWVWILTL